MKPSSLPVRNPERKGLILSLILHLLIAQFIVLTFSLKPVAHKPLFVFLGAILEPYDLTVTSTPRSSSAASRLPITTALTQGSALADSRVTATKPAFAPAVGQEPKSYLKSNFLTEETDPAGQEDLQKILGIDLSIPPRQPLRLDQR